MFMKQSLFSVESNQGRVRPTLKSVSMEVSPTRFSGLYSQIHVHRIVDLSCEKKLC